jgi:hypothetical protein
MAEYVSKILMEAARYMVNIVMNESMQLVTGKNNKIRDD